MSVETAPLKLFYCYAREDKALRDELEIHLAGLKRQYNLTHWSDREIVAGADWERTIDEHLNTADIILLLISPHFVASDYCYGKEMQRALRWHRAGSCCVIPILLHPTYWEDMPFSGIQLLPTNAKPISSWDNRYEAFHDVAKGVSTAIRTLLLSHKTKEQWVDEGNALHHLKRDEEALSAYEQALRIDANFAVAWYHQGRALMNLNRFDEALSAFNQAICFDPNYVLAWINKGNVLNTLNRYEEALSSYEEAIRLDPNYTHAWSGKSVALYKLNRHEEARQARQKADQLIRTPPRA